MSDLFKRQIETVEPDLENLIKSKTDQFDVNIFGGSED